jgi:hypothetical protein
MRFKISGMLHCVNRQTVTDLSEKYAASVIRVQQSKKSTLFLD